MLGGREMSGRSDAELTAQRLMEVVLKVWTPGSESPKGAGSKCGPIAAEAGGKFPGNCWGRSNLRTKRKRRLGLIGQWDQTNHVFQGTAGDPTPASSHLMEF